MKRLNSEQRVSMLKRQTPAQRSALLLFFQPLQIGIMTLERYIKDASADGMSEEALTHIDYFLLNRTRVEATEDGEGRLVPDHPKPAETKRLGTRPPSAFEGTTFTPVACAANGGKTGLERSAPTVVRAARRPAADAEELAEQVKADAKPRRKLGLFGGSKDPVPLSEIGKLAT